MTKLPIRSYAIKLGSLLLLAGFFAAAGGANVEPPPSELAREGQSLKAVCATCHTLQIVMDTPMSYDAWHDTVQAMVDRGASGTDQQYDDIMDYLHRTMTTVNVNTADADDLEIILNVSETVANSIIARRNTRRITSLSELKSVPGVNGTTVDGKARLIFFK